MSFFGKLLFGVVSDFFPKRHVMLTASLTLLAGCLLLFDYGSSPLALPLALVTDPARLAVFEMPLRSRSVSSRRIAEYSRKSPRGQVIELA